MTAPPPRLDRQGRPCRVECRVVEFGWDQAIVWAGNDPVYTTRPKPTAELARAEAERWLAVYLETGSWAGATEGTRHADH